MSRCPSVPLPRLLWIALAARWKLAFLAEEEDKGGMWSGRSLVEVMGVNS